MAELSVAVEHPPWPGGRCAVVLLSGDADVTGKAVEEVLAAESAKDPALLLVDLSGVSFMDSWSLHVVLRAMRGRRAAGAAAGLVCPSGPVRRVLELTGAGQLVPVFASMAEAMRSAGPPRQRSGLRSGKRPAWRGTARVAVPAACPSPGRGAQPGTVFARGW